METMIRERARFDTRLPISQKQFFEKAAVLGGYRNLTEFIIHAVEIKAKEIVKEREQTLASEKDCEIFFNEITNPQSPNNSLKQAFSDYKLYFSK